MCQGTLRDLQLEAIASYTNAHTHTHIHIRTHIHPHTYTHIHTRIYTYTHIHPHTHIHTYIHTHIYTHTYCTYIHIHILCTYIHTCLSHSNNSKYSTLHMYTVLKVCRQLHTTGARPTNIHADYSIAHCVVGLCDIVRSVPG